MIVYQIYVQTNAAATLAKMEVPALQQRKETTHAHAQKIAKDVIVKYVGMV